MAKKRLNKLISSVKKILSTAQPIDNNKIISEDDKISSSELNDLLSTPNTSNTPSIQSISRASLSTEDLNKFNTEENVRRVIEDERRSDVEEAKKDEMQRRIIFDEKIQLMKDEHQVFLKLNYPNVVGQKQIKDADIENIVASVNLRKKEIEKKESYR